MTIEEAATSHCDTAAVATAGQCDRTDRLSKGFNAPPSARSWSAESFAAWAVATHMATAPAANHGGRQHKSVDTNNSEQNTSQERLLSVVTVTATTLSAFTCDSGNQLDTATSKAGQDSNHTSLDATIPNIQKPDTTTLPSSLTSTKLLTAAVLVSPLSSPSSSSNLLIPISPSRTNTTHHFFARRHPRRMNGASPLPKKNIDTTPRRSPLEKPVIQPQPQQPHHPWSLMRSGNQSSDRNNHSSRVSPSSSSASPSPESLNVPTQEEVFVPTDLFPKTSNAVTGAARHASSYRKRPVPASQSSSFSLTLSPQKNASPTLGTNKRHSSMLPTTTTTTFPVPLKRKRKRFTDSTTVQTRCSQRNTNVREN